MDNKKTFAQAADIISGALMVCVIGVAAAFLFFYDNESASDAETVRTIPVPASTIEDDKVEPVTRTPEVPEGALERPPAIETRLDLDTNVYDPPDPVESAGSTVVSDTVPQQTDVTKLDLTWKPGEFIRKVCVAKFNGISTLCVVTTVGVLVDGSEELVYEASASKPMQIGTQLLIDNPASNCQDVASCFSILSSDPNSCEKVRSDIDWLSWQLGINASYNNGIPGLDGYPRSWVQPVYYDAGGSNLRIDISNDCSATATQL